MLQKNRVSPTYTDGNWGICVEMEINNGRNMQLDQTGFMDMGSLSRDSGCGVESWESQKGLQIVRPGG